jgi:type IV pilus assembly protein PilP
VRTLALSLVVLAATSVAGAAPQTPAPAAPPAAQSPAPAQAQVSAPTPADTFTYNPDGRRDPFVSLLTKGGERHVPRPGQDLEGVAGLAVEDLTVRGIVASPSGLVAMVQSPDRKTYLVRQGDKLLDGIVKAVTAEGLVILQEVNDPLSLVKQKEVRKMLHGNEEGK